MSKKGENEIEVINTESPPVGDLPVNPEQDKNSLISIFNEAELANQLKRHKTIGSLFDRAADVIGNYLDDPSTDLTAKMFPAKLATDIYLAQEKFRREDEKIEIEKRKLALEEAKSGKHPPIGSKFIQNNNYYSSGVPQQNNPPVDIADLKKRQEELLSSYLPNTNKNE